MKLKSLYWTFQLQRNFLTSKKLSNFGRFFPASLDSFQLKQKVSNFRLSNLKLSNFSFFPNALSNYTYPAKSIPRIIYCNICTTKIWKIITDTLFGTVLIKIIVENTYRPKANTRHFERPHDSFEITIALDNRQSINDLSKIKITGFWHFQQGRRIHFINLIRIE